MSDVVILGASGHAGVLVDALRTLNVPVAGLVAPTPPRGQTVTGVPWLGTDDVLSQLDPDRYYLVNGVGSVHDTLKRREVFERAMSLGFRFLNITHPSAVRSALATAHGEGIQILAGAVVGPGTQLGNNVLVNTRSVVEHDCTIGDHSHIATGAVICGGCRIGHDVHVGAGAVIRQAIVIGDHACVAAGAVVVKDVPAGALVVGIPAAERQKARQ